MKPQEKKDIRKRLEKFKGSIDIITRSQTPAQIRHFVIGQYPSRYFQYRQILMECGSRWDALEAAEVKRRKAEITLREKRIRAEGIHTELKEDKLTNMDRGLLKCKLDMLDVEIAEIETAMRNNERVVTGCLKEVVDMMAIAEKDFSDYQGKTEEQIEADEYDYWVCRLGQQISVDIMTTGRAQPGNLTALLSLPEDRQEQVLLYATHRHHAFEALQKRADKTLEHAAKQAELEHKKGIQ